MPESPVMAHGDSQINHCLVMSLTLTVIDNHIVQGEEIFQTMPDRKKKTKDHVMSYKL